MSPDQVKGVLDASGDGFVVQTTGKREFRPINMPPKHPKVSCRTRYRTRSRSTRGPGYDEVQEPTHGEKGDSGQSMRIAPTRPRTRADGERCPRCGNYR